MRTITASPKSNLSFKEKVALQGKPRLGEIRKVQVRIKESKEFKVSIANLIWEEHLDEAQGEVWPERIAFRFLQIEKGSPNFANKNMYTRLTLSLLLSLSLRSKILLKL